MKKGIKFTYVLMAIGFIPLLLSSIVICISVSKTTSTNLSNAVYNKLYVAADGLRQYYKDDVADGENNIPYEHDYVDMLKNDQIEMTIFIDDIRYITSALNDQGQRNEGTKMAENIWAEVKNGNDYKGDHVNIGGKDYFVYYTPLFDKDQHVIGSAWAGQPEEDVNTAIRNAITSTIIIVIISLIVCGIVILLIANRIKKSINNIVSEIKTVADGNLTSKKETSSSISEFIQLNSATVALRNKMRTIISDILQNSTNLNNSMDEVSSGVESCNQASEGIVEAVDELSKGSMEMAESVQNTNSNMIVIGENIAEIKGIADDALEQMSSVKDENKTAQTAFNKLISANNDTLSISKSVAEGIQESSQEIQKIADFASVIENIASQTNLLSLNASIEAARAGESGRGFAVVAQEISNLAAQSDKSSKDIKDIIETVVKMSDNNIKLSAQISDAVNSESTVLTDVNKSFEVVSERIDNTLEAVQDISSKVNSLDQAKASILDDISTLSSISEENAASCQETNASMAEMGTTIQNIKEESDATFDVSNKLRESVSMFRV